MDPNYPKTTGNAQTSMPEFDAYPAKSGASVKPVKGKAPVKVSNPGGKSTSGK